MKQLFLIANWKSNFTREETVRCLETYSNKALEQQFPNNKTVIVCPPFLLLPRLRQSVQEKAVSMSLGAQTISPFSAGAYTGEINGKQIKEYADYVIIGHSERRDHFGETDEVVAQKITQALSSGLTPIVCIQNVHTPIPEGVEIVAYEPPSAISTGGVGIVDTPEDAEAVAAQVLHDHSTVSHVLYGGSVDATNVHGFTQMPSISGVLVGKASLDPVQFVSLIINA